MKLSVLLFIIFSLSQTISYESGAQTKTDRLPPLNKTFRTLEITRQGIKIQRDRSKTDYKRESRSTSQKKILSKDVPIDNLTDFISILTQRDRLTNEAYNEITSKTCRKVKQRKSIRHRINNLLFTDVTDFLWKTDFEKFQEAIDANDLEKIKHLLADDVDVNARSHYEETPFHYALRVPEYPNPEIIEAFLSNQRVEVNAQEKNGHTPFHYALMQECIQTEGHINPEIIAAFVQNPDVILNITDDSQLIPLEYTITNEQVIETFYTSKRSEAMMFALWADENHNIIPEREKQSILSELNQKRTSSKSSSDIRDEVDINAVDASGLTALHRAALQGDSDTVRALIDAGINIDAKDYFGRTASDVAREHKKYSVIDILKRFESQ